MLFFLLNSLNKIHAFYQYSLNALVSVFSRGLDLAPGGRKKKEQVTLRQLQKRLSGNPGDFDDVIRKARRQSSNAGGKRSNRTTTQSGNMGPGARTACGPCYCACKGDRWHLVCTMPKAAYV
eukprot:GHRQ01026903.1.p1 GENE.GHRQ01026903.1~~GHRQ01026903.1.p1  ORF type:complete len:122 (-),score=27.43 GHRQ01026903.1:37-402(-)